MLQYVQEVQPQVMEQFAEGAPKPVSEAMKQTVTNMIGSLPPQFFKVTVSAGRASCSDTTPVLQDTTPACHVPTPLAHHSTPVLHDTTPACMTHRLCRLLQCLCR